MDSSKLDNTICVRRELHNNRKDQFSIFDILGLLPDMSYLLKSVP